MSNWVSKATNAFKGDDSSSSQAFDLSCDCGQKHSGIRRQKWQRIVCRSCGGSLFVLQRDPYPPPKDRPEPPVSPPILDEAIAEQAEQPPSVDEYAIPEPVRRVAPQKPTPVVDSRPKRALAPVVAAPSLTPRKSPGGFWKPFRVILVFIALLAVVTGYVMYQSSQKRFAEQSLREAIDKIADAILHGQWVEARNQLSTAVIATDRLGREDADAQRYRQQLRETTAMTTLLSQPISDLLTEADTAEAAGEKELEAFQYKVKGQWLFIEGRAEPILSDKKKSRVQYRIPLPMTIGADNRAVEVVIVSTELSRLMAKSESESVVLAVQIQALQPSEDKSTWQVLAEPESAVLWAYRETYQGIGYTAEDADAASATLANQAKSLGVTDERPAE